MPVRYDIAAQIPQYGGGFDPMNMMAQLQAMDYRQRQNALAEMRMGEYQRKLQAQQALRGLSPGGNFNIADPTLIGRAFGIDPDEGIKLAQLQRQLDLAKASTEAQRAAAQYHTGQLGLAERKLALETPGIQAEAAGKRAKLVPESATAVRELLRPVYMARTPEQAAERYADIYPQIKELDPNAARRLGYQYNPNAVEDFIVGPEEFKQARTPMARKPGEVVVSGTGRPGEFIETEPQYQPNAMVTNQPGLNRFAQAGIMPPGADMSAADVDPIIAKAMKKDLALRQLPPGPARETAGARMDLRDTLDQLDAGFGALADAGGIPRADAAKADNWKAAFRKSPTGQAIGGLSDSETNAQLASLRTAGAVLKAQLRKGLEMGITQMDAVKEMEKLDAAFLNPDKIKGLSEAYGSIQVLRKMIGAEGKPSAPAGRGKAGEAPTADDLDSILGIKK